MYGMKRREIKLLIYNPDISCKKKYALFKILLNNFYLPVCILLIVSKYILISLEKYLVRAVTCQRSLPEIITTNC